MTVSLIRERRGRLDHPGKMQVDWYYTITNQGIPGATSHGRGEEEVTPRALWGIMALPTPWF